MTGQQFMRKETSLGAFDKYGFLYEVNKFNTEKNLYEVSAKWTPVENAVYSVYEGDKIVQAPDNFKFDKIGQGWRKSWFDRRHT